MRKRILSVFIIMTLFISMAAPASFAASGKTKKMKVYTDVIKVGNNVYCNLNGDYIYKVNLKTGKKTKLMTNNNKHSYGVEYMSYHKGYLYYVTSNSFDKFKYSDIGRKLYRIKVKNKKRTCLYTAKEDPDASFRYAVKGKTVFTQYKKAINDDYDTKLVRKKMKLNGKSKKNSKVKVKMTEKTSNKKGYSLICDTHEMEDDLGYVTCYLKTPGKKIKILRYYADFGY